ncbi:preprotein translocase subunit SecF [Tistlia consotensis]|uniref:Protein-export membrane protein SecF n=1 Tax=Tistlia consotensis USBA 355 TaxID=560819 RepID=A0A1Y6CV16_9PROT|nr:protein translocase subunit SecF [Tistlia consotensis]SMF76947.1 protein translocase subunit secF [Tistlia consotensis USBA 355]SNS13498.1 preprotein translocase subunit SecF [Tistlia consotensis]
MALIKRVPADLGIEFIGNRRLCLAFSALLLLVSVGSFFWQGLNYGVDFRGGVLIELKTKGAADVGDIRNRISNLGINGATIQSFGEADDVLINLPSAGDNTADAQPMIDRVKAALTDVADNYRRVEFVGPKVGNELREAGALATVLALLGIAAYIWFRFEWHFAAAALIALVHDIIATVGFFSMTQMEFNLSTLAAVLTIAGYSINDTVVVFDRVREDLRKYKKMPLPSLLNTAINQTLTRTVLTSSTTLLALIALYAFGGEVIRGFSSGLIYGVVIGTYSSIGIASPLLIYFGLRRTDISLPDAETAQP